MGAGGWDRPPGIDSRLLHSDQRGALGAASEVTGGSRSAVSRRLAQVFFAEVRPLGLNSQKGTHGRWVADGAARGPALTPNRRRRGRDSRERREPPSPRVHGAEAEAKVWAEPSSPAARGARSPEPGAHRLSPEGRSAGRTRCTRLFPSVRPRRAVAGRSAWRLQPAPRSAPPVAPE